MVTFGVGDGREACRSCLSLFWWRNHTVDDIRIYYTNFKEVEKNSLIPFICSVGKAIVGNQLICFVYSSHMTVIFMYYHRF